MPFLLVYLLRVSCWLLIFVLVSSTLYLPSKFLPILFFFTSFFQFFVDRLFYTEYTILLYPRHSILTFYSVESLSIGTQPQVGSLLVSGERVVWNISKVLTSLEFTFVWKEADHILDIIKLYEDSKAINEIKGIWDNLNKRAGKVSLSNWFFLNEYPVTPRFKRTVL